MIWVLVLQLWVGFALQPGEILHGNWQSCREANGFGEQIYEHTTVRGSRVIHDWDFHLGPYHEFALYRRESDPILDWLTHDDGVSPMPDHFHSEKNLLSGTHEVNSDYNRGRRTWTVPSLGLWVNVVMAGGSRTDCESFVILVKKLGS